MELGNSLKFSLEARIFGPYHSEERRRKPLREESMKTNTRSKKNRYTLTTCDCNSTHRRVHASWFLTRKCCDGKHRHCTCQIRSATEWEAPICPLVLTVHQNTRQWFKSLRASHKNSEIENKRCGGADSKSVHSYFMRQI